MRLLLDMDGLIADFHPAVCELFGYRGSWPLGVYDCPTVFGISESSFHERLFQNPGFWNALRPTADMADIVRIVSMFDPNYIICSKPNPTCPTCASDKIRWIKRYLGHNRYILTEDKAALAGIGVLVDDHSDNVRPFGPHGFLYPRPWNEHFPYEPDRLMMLTSFLRNL